MVLAAISYIFFLSSGTFAVEELVFLIKNL